MAGPRVIFLVRLGTPGVCIASLSIHQYQMPLKVVVEEEHVFLVFVQVERTVFPLSISLVDCSISELRFRRFNSWWYCAEYLSTGYHKCAPSFCSSFWTV